MCVRACVCVCVCVYVCVRVCTHVCVCASNVQKNNRTSNENPFQEFFEAVEGDSHSPPSHDIMKTGLSPVGPCDRSEDICSRFSPQLNIRYKWSALSDGNHGFEFEVPEASSWWLCARAGGRLPADTTGVCRLDESSKELTWRETGWLVWVKTEILNNVQEINN